VRFECCDDYGRAGSALIPLGFGSYISQFDYLYMKLVFVLSSP